MKIYRVGGSVRDELLGITPEENDYVVVGATPEDLVKQKFKPVGKDFPVFLHPETHDEYALARTERKRGRGYHGFTIYAEPTVTLEEDLKRRDLTINAIAIDDQGQLTDPFGGQEDIKQKILRHVSPAFVEDPVRVLRLARFYARFYSYGFTIADETHLLAQKIVADGEIDSLVPERVWQETLRALRESYPEKFFEFLRDCGALARLFPELDNLFGVPANPRVHPEVDSGKHTLMVIYQAAQLSADPEVCFAGLCHDFGKALTPKSAWPKHPEHEKQGLHLVKNLCNRFRVPTAFRELAQIVTLHHGQAHRANELTAAAILQLLQHTDAFRREGRFEKFLLACEADSRGRTGFEDTPYPQAAYLRACLATVKKVDISALIARGLSGEDLSHAIFTARVAALEEILK